MAHYDTFREQLAINYPASGHALWEPSPRSGHDRVEVGDVGFIREGKFYRLFNALLSADHPSHRRFGVPEYHEVLVPSLSDHIDTSVLSRNHYCSAGITMETEPDFRASNPDGFPEVSFTCTRRRGGAVLSIPVQAQRQDTLARGDFGKWMLKHIDRWFAFTQRLGLGIEQMEEIVLVTGCDCARSWTNIAFLEGQGDAKASFGVKVVDGVDASINWQYAPEHIRGALLNQGPEGKNLPENQCIFIRGFRVTRIFGFLPKQLKAAGGSSDPDNNDSENDPDSAAELLPVPLPIQSRDPLHLLLDYVAERAPECDMALIHDDDLARIDGIRDSTSLEGLRPDVVMGRLRKSNLEIQRVLCDLSPRQMGLVAGTEVVRVACLSVIFNDQAQSPLASLYFAPQIMDTTETLYQQQFQTFGLSVPLRRLHAPLSSLDRRPSTASSISSSGCEFQGDSYAQNPFSYSTQTGYPPKITAGDANAPFERYPPTSPGPFGDSPADARSRSSGCVNTDSLQPGTVQNVPGSSSLVPVVPAIASEAERDTFSGPSASETLLSIPGNAVRKRPRRRYDECERLYHCSWPGCTNSYGTLNHLNAHIVMQRHGNKRTPAEFKELRKQRRELKLLEPAKERSTMRSEQAGLQSPLQPSARQTTSPSVYHLYPEIDHWRNHNDDEATVVAGTEMGSQSDQKRYGDPVSDTAHSLQSQLPRY